MEDDLKNELRMVQLHTMITEENEHKMTQLQGKMLLEQRERISKGTIVNMALAEYLTYALEKYGK